MKKFSEQTIIQSITDALQFIAMYHPPDFVKAMAEAYEKETSAPAKNAMAQILRNSKMSAIGRRAVCQDTGIVVVFAKIGMQASIDSERDLQSIVDDAVRRVDRHDRDRAHRELLRAGVAQRYSLCVGLAEQDVAEIN